VQGNTIDIKTAELAIGYEAYQIKKQQDQADGKPSTEHSQEELLNMINAVKGNNDASKD